MPRSRPRRTAVKKWPLEGVRVVDTTQNVAGPYGGMILAELGATVIKVEPPQGDVTRTWGPPLWNGISPSYLAMNRNKTSVRLDLKTKRGRDGLSKLLRDADVLLVSNRPKANRAIGIDYASVSKRYPKVIYGEILPFGRRGPRADEAGYDPLMQALTGIMGVTGRKGDSPVRVGVSIVDMAAGLWLALGTFGALRMREGSGRGHRVTVTLHETGIAWMAYHYASYWASGISPHGWGSGVEMIVPYQAFPTSDGWVIIAAGNDRLFERLGLAFGHPEWAKDARFSTNANRVKNRPLLSSLIEGFTSREKTDRLHEILKVAGVPAAPVLDAAGALKDPQLKTSGMIQNASHPDILDFKSVGLPLTIDGKRPPLRLVPP